VVGWLLAERESATLAQELTLAACTKQQIQPGQLTIHADRGSPMIAKSMALLMSDLGVVKSHSRPHVSDDNPFSEAQFRTLKYSPTYPDRLWRSVKYKRFTCTTIFRQDTLFKD
jgi:putative transposase